MTIYYQKHHIIPKHMGGTDDPENLVKVTVEQHAALHKQLWEDLGHWQDEVAWKFLSKQISIDDARRAAVSNTLKNKPKTQEHRNKIREWRKNNYFAPTLGKSLPKTEEHKRRISESHMGKPGTNTGKIYSSEHREKMRQSALKREKLSCPKCDKEMPKANLIRYHGLDGSKCSS